MAPTQATQQAPPTVPNGVSLAPNAARSDYCPASNYSKVCVLSYVFGTEMTYVCIHCEVEHTFDL